MGFRIFALSALVFGHSVVVSAASTTIQVSWKTLNKDRTLTEHSFSDKQYFGAENYSPEHHQRFGVTFDVAPERRGNKPMAMALTNAGYAIKNQKTPLVDIVFYFPTNKIQSNKVYTCTQSAIEGSECRVPLFIWSQNHSVPTDDVTCRVSVRSTLNLTFQEMDKKVGPNSFSLPSSLYPEAVKGPSFALSFECKNKTETVIKGHFTHNTKTIPGL